MMTELSLNVLDVAENSTRAGAKLVEISVLSEPAEDRITIIIKDDGCGMTEEQVKSVTDPFFSLSNERIRQLITIFIIISPHDNDKFISTYAID